MMTAGYLHVATVLRTRHWHNFVGVFRLGGRVHGQALAPPGNQGAGHPRRRVVALPKSPCPTTALWGRATSAPQVPRSHDHSDRRYPVPDHWTATPHVRPPGRHDNDVSATTGWTRLAQESNFVADGDGSGVIGDGLSEEASEEVRSRIHVMNADGSGLIRLTEPSGAISVTDPAWFPDGSKIAFRRGGGTTDAGSRTSPGEASSRGTDYRPRAVS